MVEECRICEFFGGPHEDHETRVREPLDRRERRQRVAGLLREMRERKMITESEECGCRELEVDGGAVVVEMCAEHTIGKDPFGKIPRTDGTDRKGWRQ